MTAPSQDPLIVGLGRPHGADDAVGLAVADRLLSKGIRAVHATDTAFLVDLFLEASRVLVMDAVVGSGAPGEIVILTEQDILSPRAILPVSTHAMSIPSAIKLARSLGSKAEITIVGISITPPSGVTLEMSEEVRQAIDKAADRVIDLLNRRA